MSRMARRRARRLQGTEPRSEALVTRPGIPQLTLPGSHRASALDVHAPQDVALAVGLPVLPSPILLALLLISLRLRIL